MNLYICEKPSQAKELAKAIGITLRGNGYFHNRDTQITWAVGHLLELYTPDQYDNKYKSWNIDLLPIFPEKWKSNVKKKVSSQYKVIKSLLDKANHVYIATDFDREGEAIARSLLERCRYRGNIQRVCLTALDPTSIKRALKKIKSGHETVPLYHAALARQRADWLVGMNLTRLYTDICRKLGHDEIIQIGRVLTPTVTMVCNRDEVIKNFEPKPYYTIEALVNVVNGQFKAFWQAPSHVIDGQKRCINQDYAQNVAVAIKGQTVQIAKAETKPTKQTAPLPFDLTSLQQYASKRWGYTAKKTLEACQKLYDEQAISYPRTDSRYIPVSQYGDAPAILNAISMSDPDMLKLTKCADVTHKGRAFNDKKTTAHHAIIPTMVNATVGQFSLEERNLYGVVCRFYLAQFYPDFCFMRTEIEVICKQERFVAKGKMPTELGWKSVIELPKKEKNDNEDEQEQSNLPQVQAGDDANIIDVLLQNKMTKPPAHHTEASLLSSMENIAKLAEDDRFKKILKETSGIGTPATRAGIIQGAVDRGYLIREKKSMKATDKAYMLLKLIPKSIKSPELTAAWEQELEKVATGEVELDKFMNDISGWLNKLVTRVKERAKTIQVQVQAANQGGAEKSEHVCLTCNGALKRIKGKYGFFWGCQNMTCKKTFKDNRNKPVLIIQEDGPACPECTKPMKLRHAKGKGQKTSKFWGCSGYPDCRATMEIEVRV